MMMNKGLIVMMMGITGIGIILTPILLNVFIVRCGIHGIIVRSRMFDLELTRILATSLTWLAPIDSSQQVLFSLVSH